MKFAAIIALAAITTVSAQRHGPFYTLYVEDNYDFTGNGIDIGNMKAANIEDCKDECLNAYNGNCKAISWNDYQGGTCWFKSSKGTPVYKVGVKSSGVYAWSPMICQLKDNVDITGNDLSNVAGATAAECCDKCRQTAKCRAYSWNNYNNGTCWLKTQSGPVTAKQGVQAGSIFPDPLENTMWSYDTDVVGHDIGHKKTADASSCEDACGIFAGCRAYTWTNYEGGTCWFKAKVEKVVSKAGAITGSFEEGVANAKETDDVDFVDNDFNNVAGISQAEDCVAICGDTQDCHAVTWNNFNGGTCWLKHKVDKVVPSKGVKAFELV